MMKRDRCHDRHSVGRDPDARTLNWQRSTKPLRHSPASRRHPHEVARWRGERKTDVKWDHNKHMNRLASNSIQRKWWLRLIGLDR